MRYATLGGGKRIRPVLCYLTGEAVGARAEELDAPAAAVELIHAYSLIHDDLPAMDDDDLRRGRPTTHRAFDEATAILAGDALQVLAFEILATDDALTADRRSLAMILRMLAVASGTAGMAGGQALDLAAVGRRLDLDEVEDDAPSQDRRADRGQRDDGAQPRDPGLPAARRRRSDATAGPSASPSRSSTTCSTWSATRRLVGKPVRADAAADKPTYPGHRPAWPLPSRGPSNCATRPWRPSTAFGSEADGLRAARPVYRGTPALIAG